MSSRTEVLLILISIAIWVVVARYDYVNEKAAKSPKLQAGSHLRLVCRSEGQAARLRTVAQARLMHVSSSGDDAALMQELRCSVLEIGEGD